jgi:ribosomal protection tetracycline resistance protein
VQTHSPRATHSPRTRKLLNLGILAHVDAGKTSLTERLLYAAGVIDEIGSVDEGTTQTDTLALERQRGITIKAAVTSFTVSTTTVNLLDMPGHPDFIAEVERVLSVLDGAVLVISAVEGVQAQTHVLARALMRLRIPTPAVIPMGDVQQQGTRQAAYRSDARMPGDALAEQVSHAHVYPVFFGSAMTGAGVAELMTALTRFLPAAPAPGIQDEPRGAVFKVERGPAGEKIAYVRMFAGALRTRQRLSTGKVTAIEVFGHGATTRSDEVTAGEIAKLWGLTGARIGDAIGKPAATRTSHHFAPPTMETVVQAADNAALHAALTQLAEQDPLISLRQVPEAQVITGATAAIDGLIPASQVHPMEQLLPSLTSGEGALECVFDHYEPVRGNGAPPDRPRTGVSPLNRKEYLLRVTRS